MFKSIDLNSGVTYLVELPLSKQEHDQFHYLLDQSLDKAAINRQEEFIAGRACVALGLRELGSDGQIIKRAEDRSPLWPSGYIGSITHTKDLALASVYKDDLFKSVGIDCEVLIDQERFDNIKKLITRDEDLVLLKGEDPTRLKMVQTLLFSAKEALYKAINPLCGVFFGFQEAYLSAVNFDDGSFVIVLSTSIDLIKSYEGSYVGRFIYSKTHVICSIEIKK